MMSFAKKFCLLIEIPFMQWHYEAAPKTILQKSPILYSLIKIAADMAS
jgi:hypothetical protein